MTEMNTMTLTTLNVLSSHVGERTKDLALQAGAFAELQEVAAKLRQQVATLQGENERLKQVAADAESAKLAAEARARDADKARRAAELALHARTADAAIVDAVELDVEPTDVGQ